MGYYFFLFFLPLRHFCRFRFQLNQEHTSDGCMSFVHEEFGHRSRKRLPNRPMDKSRWFVHKLCILANWVNSLRRAVSKSLPFRTVAPSSVGIYNECPLCNIFLFAANNYALEIPPFRLISIINFVKTLWSLDTFRMPPWSPIQPLSYCLHKTLYPHAKDQSDDFTTMQMLVYVYLPVCRSLSSCSTYNCLLPEIVRMLKSLLRVNR